MHAVFQLLNPALKSRLQLLKRLTTRVRACLPEEIAEHCWAANINGQTLILGIDSNALAIPVRYRQQDILRRLNNDLSLDLNLNRVKIKVVSISDGNVNPINPLQISHNNAIQLRSAADGIEDDGIRNALLRLARRGE